MNHNTIYKKINGKSKGGLVMQGKFVNEDKIFYHHKEGIRKTMCSGCPHKQSVINKEIDVLDQCLFVEGHAHVCHVDNRDGIKHSCRGICTKAQIDGYRLANENNV